MFGRGSRKGVSIDVEGGAEGSKKGDVQGDTAGSTEQVTQKSGSIVHMSSSGKPYKIEKTLKSCESAEEKAMASLKVSDSSKEQDVKKAKDIIHSILHDPPPMELFAALHDSIMKDRPDPKVRKNVRLAKGTGKR